MRIIQDNGASIVVRAESDEGNVTYEAAGGLKIGGRSFYHGHQFASGRFEKIVNGVRIEEEAVPAAMLAEARALGDQVHKHNYALELRPTTDGMWLHPRYPKDHEAWRSAYGRRDAVVAEVMRRLAPIDGAGGRPRFDVEEVGHWTDFWYGTGSEWAAMERDGRRAELDGLIAEEVVGTAVGKLCIYAADHGIDLSDGGLSSWGGRLAVRLGSESGAWNERNRIARQVLLQKLREADQPAMA